MVEKNAQTGFRCSVLYLTACSGLPAASVNVIGQEDLVTVRHNSYFNIYNRVINAWRAPSQPSLVSSHRTLNFEDQGHPEILDACVIVLL